jgi:hypothetical protein
MNKKEKSLVCLHKFSNRIKDEPNREFPSEQVNCKKLPLPFRSAYRKTMIPMYEAELNC